MSKDHGRPTERARFGDEDLRRPQLQERDLRSGASDLRGGPRHGPTQQQRFPNEFRELRPGLSHCDAFVRTRFCPELKFGCNYFHEGIDCVKFFKNGKCEYFGGQDKCRFQHRKRDRRTDREPRGDVRDSRDPRDNREQKGSGDVRGDSRGDLRGDLRGMRGELRDKNADRQDAKGSTRRNTDSQDTKKHIPPDTKHEERRVESSGLDDTKITITVRDGEVLPQVTITRNISVEDRRESDRNRPSSASLTTISTKLSPPDDHRREEAAQEPLEQEVNSLKVSEPATDVPKEENEEPDEIMQQNNEDVMHDVSYHDEVSQGEKQHFYDQNEDKPQDLTDRDAENDFLQEIPADELPEPLRPSYTQPQGVVPDETEDTWKSTDNVPVDSGIPVSADVKSEHSIEEGSEVLTHEEVEKQEEKQDEEQGDVDAREEGQYDDIEEGEDVEANKEFHQQKDRQLSESKSATPAPSLSASSPSNIVWRQYVSTKTGEYYYFNPVTKETSWDQPKRYIPTNEKPRVNLTSSSSSSSTYSTSSSSSSSSYSSRPTGRSIPSAPFSSSSSSFSTQRLPFLTNSQGLRKRSRNSPLTQSSSSSSRPLTSSAKQPYYEQKYQPNKRFKTNQGEPVPIQRMSQQSGDLRDGLRDLRDLSARRPGSNVNSSSGPGGYRGQFPPHNSSTTTTTRSFYDRSRPQLSRLSPPPSSRGPSRMDSSRDRPTFRPSKINAPLPPTSSSSYHHISDVQRMRAMRSFGNTYNAGNSSSSSSKQPQDLRLAVSRRNFSNNNSGNSTAVIYDRYGNIVRNREDKFGRRDTSRRSDDRRFQEGKISYSSSSSTKKADSATQPTTSTTASSTTQTTPSLQPSSQADIYIKLDESDGNSMYSVENVLSRIAVYRSLVDAELYNAIHKIRTKKHNNANTDEPVTLHVRLAPRNELAVIRNIEGIDQCLPQEFLYSPTQNSALKAIGMDEEVPDEIFSQFLADYRQRRHYDFADNDEGDDIDEIPEGNEVGVDGEIGGLAGTEDDMLLDQAPV